MHANQTLRWHKDGRENGVQIFRKYEVLDHLEKWAKCCNS